MSECSVCDEDDSKEYAGSILPALTRWLAHAASACATPAGAKTCGLSFTGLSASELFDDENGEADEEGAFDAFTVHHTFCATPADVVTEPAAPLAIDLPAPAVVLEPAALLDLNPADEPEIDGYAEFAESDSDDALAEQLVQLDLNPVAPAVEPEPAEPHDGWLDTHGWQAEIEAICEQIDVLSARYKTGPEPEEIDVMAAFAQSGFYDGEPEDAPVREYRLPRPIPEGIDFSLSGFYLNKPPLPDSDLAEPEPLETHE